MQFFNMKRIIVIGCPGAGKTTFSKKLSAKTGIPVIHLDALFWKDNWNISTKEEFDERLDTVLQQDCWIIDGNYSRTLPQRLAKCDQVIFLDYPRTLCFVSVLKRVLQNYGKSRSDMGGNCPERLDIPFLKYVWRFNKSQKPMVLECLNSSDIPIFVAKNRRQAASFLELL